MKRPSFQFYPGDWQNDIKLRACSPAARCLWLEMLCMFHQAEPYGHMPSLLLEQIPSNIRANLQASAKANAQAISEQVLAKCPDFVDTLARMVAMRVEIVQEGLAQLLAYGIPDIDETGVIYSGRMVKDEHIREIRASAGKKGGNKRVERDLATASGIDLLEQNASKPQAKPKANGEQAASKAAGKIDPLHLHLQLTSLSSKEDSVAPLAQRPPSEEDAVLDGHPPEAPEPPGPPMCPHVQIIDLYHRMLPTLPRVLTPRWRGSDSETHLTTRWREGLEAGSRGVGIDEFGFTTREEGLAAFKHLFGVVADSAFLRGGNNKNWKADLRWLVRPSNFTKVLEGRYSNDGSASPVSAKTSRLGVQAGDTYTRFEHFEPEQQGVPGDRRVLRFDDGLYLLGEDCVMLENDGMDELVRETLAEYEPYGQIVRVSVDQLPERVAKMRADQRRGWIQRPPIPLRPQELPEFPAMVSAAQVA